MQAGLKSADDIPKENKNMPESQDKNVQLEPNPKLN